jgi:hypothetical protein
MLYKIGCSIIAASHRLNIWHPKIVLCVFLVQ